MRWIVLASGKARHIAFGGAIVASLTPAAFAQQQTLQSGLEGTWKITAAYDQFVDGHKRNPWGENPQGVADYTPNGTFIFQIMGGNRSAKPDTNPSDPVGPAIAFFGSYTVDEQNKTYTFHVQQCTFPQWNGISRTTTVADISPTTLKIVAATIHDAQGGGDFQPHIEFERIK
jgi:Lipocalin-like domain